MRKSKTYSAIKVQSVALEESLDPWLAHHHGQTVHVGMDVSKTELQIVLRWLDRSFERPIVAKNPSQLGEVITLLKRVSVGRQLIVALEPSGTYGDIFRQLAHDAGLTVHRVSCKATHDYAEVFDGVPSQHDGKDAAVIAELCAYGKSTPWPVVEPSEDEEQLSLHADLVSIRRDEFTAACNRIEALRARHWPEVEKLLALGSATFLRILYHYGSPQALACDPKAHGQLRLWGGSLLKDEKIVAVLESAKTTVGIRCTKTDIQRIGVYARDALQAKARQLKSRSMLRKFGKGKRDIELMASVVGFVTACVLHVTVGDPANYSCGKALLKALGLNLVERSSGAHKGQLRISKRGDSQARQWLFYAALRAVQRPGISQWYRRKIERDGGKKHKALVAIMRRLALAIHRIVKDGTKFDSRRLFAGPRRRKRDQLVTHEPLEKRMT